MLANLAAADGEVPGLLEALQSRRSAEAGLVAELPDAETGRMQVLLGAPYRIDGRRMPVRSAPPLLSQDTAHVLGELLGTDTLTLADLKQDGVL
jgi:crotonobetainyl-CoA:carnitine CoA-transferase CaiB-like acyl-CoA transferase